MSEHIFALLVHSQAEPFNSLRSKLHDLSVETYTVQNCEKARDLIIQCKPQMIFTERWLPDGSWMTFSEMAKAADVPLSVIVVAKSPDIQLYLSVMERGALDFVAPPFEHEPLSFVVRTAALNTYHRRKTMAEAAAH